MAWSGFTRRPQKLAATFKHSRLYKPKLLPHSGAQTSGACETVISDCFESLTGKAASYRAGMTTNLTVFSNHDRAIFVYNWSGYMIGFGSTVRYVLATVAAGAAIWGFGLSSTTAQEAKKPEKPQIPGGIEGHVKSVDHEKETLSIMASNGKERTFKVTEETMMIGPARRQSSPSFERQKISRGHGTDGGGRGNSATEIHLGFSRRNAGDAAEAKPVAKGSSSGARSGIDQQTTSAIAKKLDSSKTGKLGTAAKAVEDGDDEDDEIPGKLKSFDATRRLLVISLLNGKSRSFLLANNVKVVVKGTPSKEGLKDTALKEGAVISVFVEAGGRRVREVHVTPLPAARSKKAA